MIRATAGRLAFCVALAAAGAAVNAEGQGYDLSIADPLPVRLELSGARTVTGRSKWHNVTLAAKINGGFHLAPVDVRALTSARGPLKTAWALPRATVGRFGVGLFRASRFTHVDPVAYAEWRGAGAMDEKVSGAGWMRCELAAVQKTGGGEVATVCLRGRLIIEEEGRVRERRGPKFWRARWDLPLEGRLQIDLTRKQVAGGSFTIRGTAYGEYEEASSRLKDPWEAVVTLEVMVRRMPEATGERIRQLIRELGHGEHARRTRATDEAQGLALETRAALIAALEGSDDPELRYRAGLLKKAGAEKPRPAPEGRSPGGRSGVIIRDCLPPGPPGVRR